MLLLLACTIAMLLEAAIQDRDVETMTVILQQTEIAYPESRAIAEAIAEHLEKYRGRRHD